MVLKIFTDGGARGNPGPAAAAFVVYQGRNTAQEGLFRPDLWCDIRRFQL